MLITGSFIVDIISLKKSGVFLTKRYMFLKEAKSKTFLKKLARRRYTVLLFVKAFPFSKNFAIRPRDRKNSTFLFCPWIVGKNRPLVKFSAKVLVGLKYEFLSKLYPLTVKLYFFKPLDIVFGFGFIFQKSSAIFVTSMFSLKKRSL